MMKAPSKTKLLTMRSYIDAALATPEDTYGASRYMERLWNELFGLCDREELKWRFERIFSEQKEKPPVTDPETLEMIVACKKWREDQKLIEDTTELSHDGETWKETQDRIFREMQAESGLVPAVGRSGTFVAAQEMARGGVVAGDEAQK